MVPPRDLMLHRIHSIPSNPSTSPTPSYKVATISNRSDNIVQAGLVTNTPFPEVSKVTQVKGMLIERFFSQTSGSLTSCLSKEV
jgi:hypothetical protein